MERGLVMVKIKNPDVAKTAGLLGKTLNHYFLAAANFFARRALMRLALLRWITPDLTALSAAEATSEAAAVGEPAVKPLTRVFRRVRTILLRAARAAV